MRSRVPAISIGLGAALVAALAFGSLALRPATPEDAAAALAPAKAGASGSTSPAMCEAGERVDPQALVARAVAEDRARDAARAPVPAQEGELLNTRGYNYASGAALLDTSAVEFESRSQR